MVKLIYIKEIFMFTYIDAICLVVFALCILLGVWKGFFHTLSKFFSTTVKLAISFILCKPVAKLISSISHFDEHLFDKYSAWAGGLSENFSVNLKTIMQIIRGLEMTTAEFFNDPIFEREDLDID